MSNQVVMICLNDLIPKDHVYRKFSIIWKFEGIRKLLKGVEKKNNYKGYGISRLFRCLLLQFMQDLSDRELERYLNENNAAKWFCGFDLTEATPDYTVFGKTRSRIGTELLAKLFNNINSKSQPMARS